MEAKRILVVSDSHNHADNIERILKKEGAFDCFVHLGDGEREVTRIQSMFHCPCYMVMGNCDSESDKLPSFTIINLGKHSIFATHGHKYWVNMGTEFLANNAKMYGCDFALYGHTHIPDMHDAGGITVLNPGSVSLPRQTGHKKTYMILEVKEDGDLTYELRFLDD